MGMNGSGFRVWSGAIGMPFYCSGCSDFDSRTGTCWMLDYWIQHERCLVWWFLSALKVDNEEYFILYGRAESLWRALLFLDVY
jgi:hypothetical protein